MVRPLVEYGLQVFSTQPFRRTDCLLLDGRCPPEAYSTLPSLPLVDVSRFIDYLQATRYILPSPPMEFKRK